MRSPPQLRRPSKAPIRAVRRLDPLQFVTFALAGWFNQQQQDIIDYLREPNKVLRE
jgi:hypothetical protein